MNTQLKLAALASVIFAAVSANAVDYMDQIGTVPNDFASGAVDASQRFGDFPTFSIGAIDDFTLGGNIQLTSVQAAMGMFNTQANQTWANVGDFNVDIYSSVAAGASNLDGDKYHALIAHASATIDSSYFSGVSAMQTFQPVLVTIPINVTLGAGTYWIGITPVADFGTVGQTGVWTSGYAGANPGGSNAFQVNPGGGFGFTGNQSALAVNLGYRVSGAPVPEPASMAVLGIGALAMLRRRMKKA